MNILILNGSPRLNGNTKKMIAAFTEGASTKGHKIDVVDVAKKKINGCQACEYCHTRGNGQCIQKDDMQEIYDLLKTADMLVLASPIYYHNVSGQLKCAIDRFYAAAYPSRPPALKKVATLLSSGASGVYDGAKYSFDNDFVGYLGLENAGVITAAGNVSSKKIEECRLLGASLK